MLLCIINSIWMLGLSMALCAAAAALVMAQVLQQDQLAGAATLCAGAGAALTQLLRSGKRKNGKLLWALADGAVFCIWLLIGNLLVCRSAPNGVGMRAASVVLLSALGATLGSMGTKNRKRGRK